MSNSTSVTGIVVTVSNSTSVTGILYCGGVVEYNNDH